jgi:hypothetical protein
VPPTACELAELGGQIVETRFRLTGKRLTQYLAMLGFGRAAMPCRPPLEAQDQIVVEIANAEAAWHRALHLVMAMANLATRRKRGMAGSPSALLERSGELQPLIGCRNKQRDLADVEGETDLAR